MQKIKMSLANIQGKLSRVEMKNIMAGDGPIGEFGMQCMCTDGQSAGMVSCDTCSKYCKDHGHGDQSTCD